MLRYKENFIIYTKLEDVDLSGIVEVIKSYDGGKMVSGKKDILERVQFAFEGYKVSNSYFCQLSDMPKPKYRPFSSERIVNAQAGEDLEIHDFIESIEEFSGLGNKPGRYASKIESGTGRVYYIRNEVGEIVTCAQTTAENSMSAMVVGVATHKAYRGQGYMSTCLSQLCQDLIQEGKSLCLFYSNPAAGSVYLNMGFKPIGQWMTMMSMEKQ